MTHLGHAARASLRSRKGCGMSSQRPYRWGKSRMLRIVVVSAAILPILVGCAAPSAQLVNDKGQNAQCSAVGLGLGALIALSMEQTCVDRAQKQGYHQVAARGTPAAATSTNSVAGALGTSTASNARTAVWGCAARSSRAWDNSANAATEELARAEALKVCEKVGGIPCHIIGCSPNINTADQALAKWPKPGNGMTTIKCGPGFSAKC
jgi:hypothetical protein